MNFQVILNLHLLHQLENANRRHRNRLDRRVMRDGSDPFVLNDDLFESFYRLKKPSVHYLLVELGPHIKERDRITGVPVQLKVFVALYFFAHGSYQRCVGSHDQIEILQPTVSKILTEVSNVIVNRLLNVWVVFPKQEEDRRTIQTRFFQKHGFPGIIGAIDCTHIAIVAPPTEDPVHPGLAYYNRKGYYSLNVQMICDTNLKILNCNARFPGSSHDSAIWSLSAVKQYIQNEYIVGRLRSTWLIGDAGYALQPWLLTPVDNAVENTAASRYNDAHISARNCIERCFGVLKQRFRCLLKHRTLHYKPVKAAKIVYSCVILHNICIANGDIRNDDVNEELEQPNINEPIQRIEDENWLVEGRRIRTNLVNNLFN